MTSTIARLLGLSCALSAAIAMIAAVSIASAGERDAAASFQRIIASQIDAFRRDAGAEAFAHASPGIRAQFGTANNFMTMVKKGYPQVYRPQSFKFGKVTKEMAGRPTQRVHIVDSRGQSWTALYAFEQQADGTWRIAGVVMLREEDVSA